MEGGSRRRGREIKKSYGSVYFSLSLGWSVNLATLQLRSTVEETVCLHRVGCDVLQNLYQVLLLTAMTQNQQKKTGKSLT